MSIECEVCGNDEEETMKKCNIHLVYLCIDCDCPDCEEESFYENMGENENEKTN